MQHAVADAMDEGMFLEEVGVTEEELGSLYSKFLSSEESHEIESEAAGNDVDFNEFGGIEEKKNQFKKGSKKKSKAAKCMEGLE